MAASISTAVANARAYDFERRRAQELEALNRAKTTFFSNVSHEFRTPLTLMLGPIEQALSDQADPLGPAQAERLVMVRRNALRLQRLVNSLLDFSRAEAGRLDTRFAPVDLAALTAEIASTFRAAFQQAGIELIVDCPPFPEQCSWTRACGRRSS